jgi:peptidoglycan/xylan/chitin deacetylase (PgdA/CDA1 family)
VVVLLCAFAFASGWAAFRPVRVRFDGRVRRVRFGSTVQTAMDEGWLRCEPGDLLGVDGKVVERGGGDAAQVTRNGSPSSVAQLLYQNDVIAGKSGADTRESLVTTREPVPFQTICQGEGSLATPKTLGAPGTRVVTRGERSGIEVTSTVLVMPSDMVIVRQRPAGGRLVALTFDDGPFPGQTERILDTLARYQVKATFFMLGVQLRRYPALAQRVVAEGHSVGSHTYWHDSLNLESPARSRREVIGGRRALKNATGVNSRWMRPPYGGMDAAVWRTVRSLKMSVVMWDVDSNDWRRPGTRAIVATVLRDTKPGSVILMHDGGGDRAQTAAALAVIIPRLEKAGYTFVTVDELARARYEARKKAAMKAAPKPPATQGGG